MFFQDRGTTLDGLAVLGASLCGYCSGEPESWLTGRCDCKYGGPVPRPTAFGMTSMGTERTGCPELRSIYKVVSALTDAEWVDLLNRSGGITTAQLADAFRDRPVITDA